jgi:hypothetical protein
MRPSRRPTALEPNEEKTVIRFIEAEHANGSLITQRDMLNSVESEFGKRLTYRWMHNCLVRRADRVCRAIIPPQEKPRIEFPQLVLDKYLVLIKEYIPLVLTELNFNIDECGFSNWEKRRSKPLMILTGIRNSTFQYPVNRGIRHQTLIYCITAADNAYCPLLASSDPAVR